MKILIVTAIFPPEIGGPATYSSQLAKSLNEKQTVVVITFSDSKNSQSFKTISVSKSGSTLIRQWRMIKAIWKETAKCNVIFAQDPLVVGVAAGIVAIFKQISLVVKFVGDIAWEDARSQSRFEDDLEGFYGPATFSLSDGLKVMMQRRVLGWAKKVITPSSYLKDFLTKRHHVNSRKITVIYNGVKRLIKSNSKKDPMLAITVARLVSWKGIGEIIRVVAQIPRLRYLVVGEGPESHRLQRLVKDLHLSNRVKLLGSLDATQVQHKLVQASIYIMNSSYEGLPHVLLEAAAAKNKIIAPSLPGVKEVFSNKEAWLFKPGSKKGLLGSLKLALKDETKKEEKAFQKVVSDFSWEVTFQKTKALLEGVINK